MVVGSFEEIIENLENNRDAMSRMADAVLSARSQSA